jgi:SAM-dependent methyltransferase
VSSPTIWSCGHYEAVAQRIAPIAAEVIDAVERRLPMSEAMLVDLACGTGNAALVAAARGAQVTAVDITAELIAIGAANAEAAGRSVAWVTADASETGLPGGSFDAAVSNMGIIFVEPVAMVAEISRLLKPGGAVGFSSWVRDPANPFFAPIVEVLGPPPASGYSPDQWGEPDTITARLATDFDDIDIQRGWHAWQFESVAAGMHFLTGESPLHVDLFNRVDAEQSQRLRAAFQSALQAHAKVDGSVSYQAPYVVVTGRRTRTKKRPRRARVCLVSTGRDVVLNVLAVDLPDSHVSGVRPFGTGELTFELLSHLRFDS